MSGSVVITCVECGDEITGKVVMISGSDRLVELGILHPGPHCAGCHAEAQDSYDALP